MIFLLNETEKKWETPDRRKNFLKISKNCEVIGKDREIHYLNCRLFLTSANQDFLNKVKNDIESVTKTTEIVKVCSDDTSVLFGYKDLNPFIIQSRNGNNRNVLLMNLDIRDKVIYNLEMGKNFIIEHINNADELNLIISMDSNLKSKFTIYAFDKKEKDIIRYNVEYDQNGNLVYKKQIEKVVRAFTPPALKIENTRPKRPTQIVICSGDSYQKMESTMKKVVKDNIIYYTLYTYFNENGNETEDLIKLIDEVKQLNYSVITLFIDSNESIDIIKEKYKVVLRELTTKFKVVYILLNNCSLIQYKF